MEGIRQEISEWIDSVIIPQYDAFDKGHGREHAHYVIETALELSQHYDVDKEMIVVAAACHDLGLSIDRKNHHLESGKMVRGMKVLEQWFSPEQTETVAQAVEDHRASSDHSPRSIYGKIIAEADRQIIPEVVIRRTIQFGMKNCPDRNEEIHWQRTVGHLEEKYADGGYLRLWIPESPNAKRLEELRVIIRDKEALHTLFRKIYEEELLKEKPLKDGTSGK